MKAEISTHLVWYLLVCHLTNYFANCFFSLRFSTDFFFSFQFFFSGVLKNANNNLTNTFHIVKFTQYHDTNTNDALTFSTIMVPIKRKMTRCCCTDDLITWLCVSLLVFNVYDSFVHYYTTHLDQSSSCLLLTRTVSARLLAAVQPIISLPPFLCSLNCLGHAQGRKGEGGREETIKGRAPLLWHRHKGIPFTRVGPAHSLTLTLSGSQTQSRPYTLLSAQSEEKQTHERDEEWETQWNAERGKFNLEHGTGEHEESRTGSEERSKIYCVRYVCLLSPGLKVVVYFLLFYDFMTPQCTFLCLEPPVSHREALHTPATCWSGQIFTRSDSMCADCTNIL